MRVLSMYRDVHLEPPVPASTATDPVPDGSPLGAIAKLENELAAFRLEISDDADVSMPDHVADVTRRAEELMGRMRGAALAVWSAAPRGRRWTVYDYRVAVDEHGRTAREHLAAAADHAPTSRRAARFEMLLAQMDLCRAHARLSTMERVSHSGGG